MEGDILMGDRPTTLIGIREDHDERPEILQIKDSGPILGCITFKEVLSINGFPFKKVLIYKEAYVNILPYKRMEKLGKTKVDLIPSELTISNFAGTITAIHGILIIELEVGSKNLMVSYLAVDNTSSYHALRGRDQIHQTMNIPSYLQHELLMWNEEIKDYEIVKADPKPFLLPANSIAARFYNEDIARLTVSELIKNGHSQYNLMKQLGLAGHLTTWNTCGRYREIKSYLGRSLHN
ncbi:unnamed protein product [Prunus armeniaca]